MNTMNDVKKLLVDQEGLNLSFRKNFIHPQNTGWMKFPIHIKLSTPGLKKMQPNWPWRKP